MEYQHQVLNHCDPEQLAEIIDGSHMRHRVLPGGTLGAELETLHMGSIRMQRGLYSMGILVDGAWPSDMITVGFVLEAPTDATVNGFACPPLSIQLYCEGCELCYRAAPGSTWFILLVERERIQQAALRLYGRPLPIPETGSTSIEPEELDAKRIAAAIHVFFAMGAYPNPTQNIDALYRLLEEQFHYDLACALHNGRRQDRSREARRVAQRRSVMRRAEEYLRANISGTFSLSELADAAGTSARTLESRFLETYGVTPLTWFRSMKLNEIHKELQRSRGTGQRVSDIAMRLGFLHFGRFAEEYRRLFGECPRDTLTRQPKALISC